MSVQGIVGYTIGVWNILFAGENGAGVVPSQLGAFSSAFSSAFDV